MADHKKVTLAQLLGPGTYKSFKSDRKFLLFHCHICDHGCGRPDEVQRHFKLMHPEEWSAMKGDFNYNKITVWQKRRDTGEERRITAKQYRKGVWRDKEMPTTSVRQGLKRIARPAVGIRKETNAKKPGGLLNQRPTDAAALAAAVAAAEDEDEDEEDDDDDDDEDENDSDDSESEEDDSSDDDDEEEDEEA